MKLSDPTGTLGMSRLERARRFGIDAGDTLVWRNWSVGGEYERKLTIINTSTETQKIRYQLPKTKYFFMDYPELEILSPGMTRTFSVSFRPIVKEEYYDLILIETAKGLLAVKVCALLPLRKIKVPKSLDMGLCPTKEIKVKSFYIENNGELPSFYRWQDPPKFLKISPMSGEISAGKQAKIRIELMPESAASITSVISCYTNATKDPYRLTVRAIAKYPYLSVEGTSNVQFGEVLTNQRIVRELEIMNNSEVSCRYKITRLAHATASVFTISPNSGHISAGERMRLRITYLPVATGTISNDTYEISTPGGNSLHFTCEGSASGPLVTIDESRMDMGELPLGKSSAAYVVMRNFSKIPVAYDFLVAGGSEGGGGSGVAGTFRVDKPKGVISPLLSLNVKVKFVPSSSINYYQKMYILIENSKPLTLELFGTCFDETRRPEVLTIAHIDQYLLRCAVGQRLASDEKALRAIEESRDLDIEKLPAYQELFDQTSDPTEEVVITPKHLNFGFGDTERPNSFKVVDITNRSLKKMLCVWDLQEDKSYPFVMVPKEASVAPGTTIQFKVYFRPMVEAEYYFATLACYVFPKTQRSFRLVDKSRFQPPLCVRLECIGHSFTNSQVHFIPYAKFSFNLSNGLRFPPCAVGAKVYLTVVLRNDNRSPLVYDFTPYLSEKKSSFQMHPSSGVVRANALTLLAFQFCPVTEGRVSSRMRVMLNYSTVVDFQVTGTGEGPKVQILSSLDSKTFKKSEEKDLFFKPTGRGNSSKASVTLHNASQLPTAFRWQIPERFRSVLEVNPYQGVLRGNEMRKTTWTFSPKVLKSYKMVAHCSCQLLDRATTKSTLLATAKGKSIGGDAFDAFQEHRRMIEDIKEDELLNFSHKDLSLNNSEAVPTEIRRVKIEIHGKCIPGSLKLSPESLNLSHSLVNHPRRAFIVLENNSDVAINYKFSVQEILPTPRFIPPRFFRGLNQNSELQPEISGNPGILPEISGKSGILQEGSGKSGVENLGESPEISEESPEGGVGYWVVVDRSCAQDKGDWQKTNNVVSLVADKCKRYGGCSLMLTGGGMATLAHHGVTTDIAARVRASGRVDTFSISFLQIGTHPDTENFISSLSSGREGAIIDTISKGLKADLNAFVVSSLCVRTDFSLNAKNSSNWGGKVESPKKGGGDGFLEFFDCSGGYRFSFDHPNGTLPPRTSEKTYFSFCSEIVGDHRFRILCQIVGSTRGARVNRECEVHFSTNVSYPRLIVKDASLSGFAHYDAWMHLGLPSVNLSLTQPLTKFESDLNAERVSTVFKAIDVAEKVTNCIMRLGPRIAGEDPTLARLQLYNPGHNPTKWHLHFPDDSTVDPEKWADMSNSSPEELTRKALVIKRIFSAYPRSGLILPGESATLTLRYKHAFVGEHTLKVILQAKHGKWTCLQLIGTTVAGFPKCLSILPYKKHHIFKPTPIGLALPPSGTETPATIKVLGHILAAIQTYEIHNPSDYTLSYRVDAKTLKLLCEKAYGAEILKINNPVGSIPPRGKTSLHFRFRPLEDCYYHVVIPLICEESPAASEKILFSGRGFHPILSGSTGQSPALGVSWIVDVESNTIMNSTQENGNKIKDITEDVKLVGQRKLTPLKAKVNTENLLMQKVLSVSERVNRWPWEAMVPSSLIAGNNPPAMLSVAHICLGIIRPFEQSTGLVTITNPSPDSTLFFTWTSLPSYMTIKPITGAIQPSGGFAVFRVTVTAGYSNKEIVNDIECVVSSSQEKMDAFVYSGRMDRKISPPLKSLGPTLLAEMKEENLEFESQEESIVRVISLRVSASVYSPETQRVYSKGEQKSREDNRDMIASLPLLEDPKAALEKEKSELNPTKARKIPGNLSENSGKALEMLVNDCLLDPIFSKVLNQLTTEEVVSFRELKSALEIEEPDLMAEDKHSSLDLADLLLIGSRDLRSHVRLRNDDSEFLRQLEVQDDNSDTKSNPTWRAYQYTIIEETFLRVVPDEMISSNLRDLEMISSNLRDLQRSLT
ncbi:hypothetical protein AAMO2058_001081600 [Amorphochlora amoebiformis]